MPKNTTRCPPARTRARTARSGDELTNHEATAPPDRRRILASFAKFCCFFSQIAFCNMIVPFNRYHLLRPARALASLHLPHVLFDTTNLYKLLPGWQFVLRVRSLPISTRKRNVAGKFLNRFSEILHLKLTAGEGFCKDLLCPNTHVGDGGDLELISFSFFTVLRSSCIEVAVFSAVRSSKSSRR